MTNYEQFAIQFTVLVSGSPLAERVITIAAIPLILIFLVLAAVALRYENKWGMYCFLVGQIAGLVRLSSSRSLRLSTEGGFV